MNLTNSQYEEVMSVYYERQTLNQHTKQARADEIEKAIPQIQELDMKYHEFCMQQAISGIGKDRKASVLDDAATQVKEQKAALLVDHGYPADYLDDVYTCPDCKDSGYIDGVPCHCLEKEIVRYLYSQSNLEDILADENFSHFNFDYYTDNYIDDSTGLTPKANIKNVVEGVILPFLDGFDEGPENLMLYGYTGVGKTFLTHCIAKELLDHSHTVIYLTSHKLFDILEKCKFSREVSEEERAASLSYILSCELLIIDDLGTELINSFTASQLFYCLETRLADRRSTIISTNLSPEGLKEQYSERVYSRIIGNYTILHITGDDIRKKKLDN